MEKFGITFITIGFLLMFGVLAYVASRKIVLPQVTILILLGVAAGPSGLDLLPETTQDWYPLVSTTALLFVGFLLGSRLSLAKMRDHGVYIIAVSIGEVLGVAVFVFTGLLAIGTDPVIALLLAGIGPASAPAAIQSVVMETKAAGRFTDTLLGVVAIDDAWGLIVFSVLLVIAGAMGTSEVSWQLFFSGIWEITGAMLIGIVIGIPSALLVNHLREGQPMEAEAIGVVLLSGGLAIWMNVSFLLAAMTLGVVITNLARNREELFDYVEKVEWPFLVMFFVLSGASLHLELLLTIGMVGGLYILLRTGGLIFGAFVGGRISKFGKRESLWMGFAIQPQAGVALGMVLVAGSHFPELGDILLAIIIGSTVVYEIAGPVLTRLALSRTGEIGQTTDNGFSVSKN